MSNQTLSDESSPILIIGAGISGLLLAQELRRSNIPFQIFERDTHLSSRGAGWGLTLNWSLPALRELLPDELVGKLRDTYVDLAGVNRGETSQFPFYDLSTGERKGASPPLSESQRIRVKRERLRNLLATGIEIQWGKVFQDLVEESDSVTATFEDGSTYTGRLLVGCDGSHSRVRRKVYGDSSKNSPLPVRMLGFTLKVTSEQAKPVQALDPFYLMGTASVTDTFTYISLLDAPQEENSEKNYVYQIAISWNLEKSPARFTGSSSTPEERINVIRSLAKDWAEPFRSLLLLIPDTTDVKQLDLDDFAPHNRPEGPKSTILIGDAYHTMTMFRGEGANHAIVDVLDFKQQVLPHLRSEAGILRAAMGKFEEDVVRRTRPAVAASRQACLDAHDFAQLSPTSPLLTRRQMWLESRLELP